MNRTCILIVLVIALSLGAAAYSADSVYPGSKLVFDMNLTEKDFLPAIKQLLPQVANIAGAKIGSEVNMPAPVWAQIAQQLTAAISGLKSVSVSYFELANPDAAKITQFYAPRIGLNADWNPVLRLDAPGNQGSARLYVKPGFEEVFGLGAYPKGYVVVHTTGPIDITKLSTLAAQMIPMIMEMRSAAPPAPAPPAPTTEQSPAPAPAPVPAQ